MSDNKPVLIALVVVGLALVGTIVYFVTQQEEQPPAVVEPVAIQEVEREPEPPVEPEPEPIVEEAVEEPVTPPEQVQAMMEPEPEVPAFVLPGLDASDSLIREGAVSLTRHEGVNGWLSPNELVRKFVVFIDNLAHGSVPKEPAAVLGPETPFAVQKLGEKTYLLDVASYERYNLTTNILTSIDSARAVEFYVLLKPLFQKAYDELGYPNAKFDDAFVQAIEEVLKTPILHQPVRLVRPVVMYEFEDPEVEALSPVQKQLIRMGPDNTRAIQAKLKELQAELQAVSS